MRLFVDLWLEARWLSVCDVKEGVLERIIYPDGGYGGSDGSGEEGWEGYLTKNKNQPTQQHTGFFFSTYLPSPPL